MMRVGALGHTFPTDLMKIGIWVGKKELASVPVARSAGKQLLTC